LPSVIPGQINRKNVDILNGDNSLQILNFSSPFTRVVFASNLEALGRSLEGRKALNFLSDALQVVVAGTLKACGKRYRYPLTITDLCFPLSAPV